MSLKFILAILFMILSSAGFAGWYHHEFHEGRGIMVTMTITMAIQGAPMVARPTAVLLAQ